MLFGELAEASAGDESVDDAVGDVCEGEEGDGGKSRWRHDVEMREQMQ
jgi:hypothetical protein